MTVRRTRGRRAVGALDCALGVVTVARARDIAKAPWLGFRTVTVSRIVLVLGLRQILEGIAVLVHPTRPVTRTVALIDVLHGASMLPVAVTHGPYSRQASTSALLAAGTAIAACAVSRRD